jgi:Ca2+-binding RTX toxin-like protein
VPCFEGQQRAIKHFVVPISASETKQKGKHGMKRDQFNHDRRPEMNRIDINLRATRRRALLIGLLMALLLALGAAAPVVLAAITCPGGKCVGTAGNDTLQGTAGVDVIDGNGGADTINGFGGNDLLFGDFLDGPHDPALDGPDRIYGGGGADELDGLGGADLLVGGSGGDSIDAREGTGNPPGTDTVRGGRGNDTIYAKDGAKDKIDCGPGRDVVQFDRGIDTVTSCEEKTAA